MPDPATHFLMSDGDETAWKRCSVLRACSAALPMAPRRRSQKSRQSGGAKASTAGLWVAQEKIHGAQLVIGVEGGQAFFGKRKAWLADDEPFFGWQLLRGALTEAALAIRAALGEDAFLYGELFGGAYPHPDVPPVPGLQAVQTGTVRARHSLVPLRCGPPTGGFVGRRRAVGGSRRAGAASLAANVEPTGAGSGSEERASRPRGAFRNEGPNAAGFAGAPSNWQRAWCSNPRRRRRRHARAAESERARVLGAARLWRSIPRFARAPRSPSTPWASSLGGVVTLGGVIYGTPLADATEDPSNPTAKLIARLTALKDSLEDCRDDEAAFTRGVKIAANNHRWIKAGAELAVLAASTPKHPEIAFEGIDPKLPEFGRTSEMIKRMVFKETLNLDRPVTDYCANLTRFKTLVTKVLAGADTLTTRARLEWWRSHVVPSDLKLYALTGTMGDVTPAAGKAWALVNNPAAYNVGSIDHKSLRGNYYDLVDAGRMQLNDSQVPVSRGRFWPELSPARMPRKKRRPRILRHSLGTHHWGMAFPEAFTPRTSARILTRAPFFSRRWARSSPRPRVKRGARDQSTRSRRSA